MRKFYTFIAALVLTGMVLNAQRYLDPEPGFKVAYLAPEQTVVQSFDVSLQHFYFDDGTAVYRVDPFMELATDTFPFPADYPGLVFPGFLNLNPAGTEIWAGYTNTGNTDSRIYCIDVVSGNWKLAATMPGNYDLEFWGDSLLVSATNSSEFGVANGIWVLDTTGNNAHRKIIETGGYSAGLAVDAVGNLYYGTSDMAGPFGLYRWSAVQVAALVSNPLATPLGLADAELLSDLPMGANDVEVDAAGNLVFTMNVWGGEAQVLGLWNDIPGAGNNYDTLATSASWLGMVKSRGDFTNPIPGFSLFTSSYGMPVADLHSGDYPPVLTGVIPEITGFAGDVNEAIDLNPYVIDLDDPSGMSFEVTYLSDDDVATLTITEDTLLNVNFAAAGQANVQITATSAGQSVRGTTVAGTWPVIEGEFLVSDMNEQSLEAESFWNGRDGSGVFASGEARFHNSYDQTYFSWSGMAYSNTSDVSTAGFMNQYSAITGEGFNEGEEGSGIYAVSNLYGPALIDFTDQRAFAPEGFFVTNATYAALSMEQGDFFAKQFGGADSTDPDFFTLFVWGTKSGKSTDSVMFSLADYTFETPDDDYIIKTWQWVDLSSLGKVDTLLFGLNSSDVGDFGMNTPAYFCLDDLYLNPDAAPFVANPVADITLQGCNVDTTLDLRGVFGDLDDEDDEIVISVVDVQSPPIQASLDGYELTISGDCVTKKAMSPNELVLEGVSNGLTVRDTFLIYHDVQDAIEGYESLALHVWPNPGHGEFLVEGPSGEAMDMRVYSYTGQEVLHRSDFVSGSILDLSSQPAGAYIIRVSNSQGTGNLLVQKL